jgi:hypothetical protein
MNRGIIAHELGHVICAEVQDGLWKPTGISLTKATGSWAETEFKELTKRKSNLHGPYSKTKYMANLGGAFGELLVLNVWHPWCVRADVDEFITANIGSANSPIVSELSDWLWRDDDALSFKACSSCDGVRLRRKFTIDHHDTCRRLPRLWDAYIDFCDRIDKKAFATSVDEILRSHKKEIIGQDLKELIKAITQ